MTDLNELADLCERAAGPDRALDEEMFCGLGLAPFTEGAFDAYRAPAYTSSIDAAMTLVPDGQDWYVTAIRPLKGTFAGAIYRGIHPKIDYAEAATPALALTAAALRARAATPVQVNEVVG